MLEIVNQISTFGVLITLLISVVSFLALAFFYKDKNWWLNFVQKNALNLYLTLLVGAVVIILYYSEVALFTPCKLCWFQRMFIFPQILLIIVAKFKKDLGTIWSYLAWMTGFAFVISALHNYVYYFGKETSITCDAAASCKAYYVSEYGFITIPFMAFGLLVGLATILVVRKYYKGNTLPTI